MPNCRPGDLAIIIGPPAEICAVPYAIGRMVRVIESTHVPREITVPGLDVPVLITSFSNCAPYWFVETDEPHLTFPSYNGIEFSSFKLARFIWPDCYLRPIRGEPDETSTPHSTPKETTDATAT